MAKQKDNELIPWQNNLTGRCITSLDAAKIEMLAQDNRTVMSDNFSTLKNMKYTDNGIVGVTGGMTKVNTTPLSSHSALRTIIHFDKVQPVESHVIVQAWNLNTDESKVYQNVTAIGEAGDFEADVLHTDLEGSGIGRWSTAPDEHIAYCNSVETLTWGGDETTLSNFTIYDPNGAFLFDYTTEVQNTLDDADNIATLKQSDGIGEETLVLYHFEDTAPFQDYSPVGTRVATAVNGAQRSDTQPKFGTYGCWLNASDEEYLTIENFGNDFDYSFWSFEKHIYLDSEGTIQGLFSWAEEGWTQDYLNCYIDANNAIKFSIFQSDETATGTVTLDTGAEGSVNSITVDSIEIMSGAESFDSTLAITATAVAANITAHTSDPNYTAEATDEVITITPDRAGGDVNGYVVESTCTTITSSDVDLAGGTNIEVVSISTANDAISAGVQTHFRLVQDESNFYMFVNGALKASTFDVNRLSTIYNSLFYVGVRYDGVVLSDYLDGYIDELRITTNALSTSDFEVPASEYSSATGNANIRVGNTLPIEAINFTVSEPNTSTGVMSVFYWAGGEWTELEIVDGTAAGGIPLAQDGAVTFDSTALTAKPSIIKGVLGFWYKIQITEADITTALSHVTVTEPFQVLQDFWDGGARTANSVQLFEDDINKDNTINVFKDSFLYYENTGGDLSSYMIMSKLDTDGEYLQVGFPERSQGVQIKMVPNKSNDGIAASMTVQFDDMLKGRTLNTFTIDDVSIISGQITSGTASESAFAQVVAEDINKTTTEPDYTAEVNGQVLKVTSDTKGAQVNDFEISMTSTSLTFVATEMAGGITTAAILTVSYWNGGGWTTVGDIDDGTISNNSSFAKSGYITWDPLEANVEFKKEINKEQPLYYYKFQWDEKFSDETFCYNITGIPVQRTISNYKFPLSAKGRLWLFADMAGIKNKAICSNLNELNTFNGTGVGDPLYFGDKSEIVAAIEIFERTTSKIESNILILKANSAHVLQGDNPEEWNIINLVEGLGCNAPLTLAVSTLGLEYSPLQRKQIAIWQGNSGIYIFDNNAIHPISDDISDIFDQKHAHSINLLFADKSYGFFEVVNGEHYYHYCYASGTSETLDKEWVFDMKRQKWFEINRGTDKAIQGGTTVIDLIGNSHTYAFEDNGYLQELNKGTNYDGNAIDYEFSLGDNLPGGTGTMLTSLDAIKLTTVSKETTSNSIIVYHYGDTKDTATMDQAAKTNYYTLPTANTGSRLAFPFKRINTPPHITHKLKFTMSTDDEAGTGFEPLYIGGFYKTRGLSELSIND